MADQNALREIAREEIALADRPADTFTLAVNGHRYSVQRFCPHAGFDLSQAEVVEGSIVCPGHRWHFDLETGRCTESGYRIFCTRVAADGMAAAAEPEMTTSEQPSHPGPLAAPAGGARS
jgi:nitrite reductase/ring-hydroxylating ferredoxin subunit